MQKDIPIRWYPVSKRFTPNTKNRTMCLVPIAPWEAFGMFTDTFHAPPPPRRVDTEADLPLGRIEKQFYKPLGPWYKHNFGRHSCRADISTGTISYVETYRQISPLMICT